MLKNNFYTRVLITILLIIAVVYYPLALILVLLPIFYFPNYIESLVVGIIIDSLYGTNGSIIYTSSVFVAFVIIEITKRRLRL
jgi:hypothetical protein